MKRRDLLTSCALGTAASLTFSGRAACREPDSAEPKRSVRFAHLTDVHIHPGRSAPQGLAEALNQIHGLADTPEFIINGGDAIDDALEASREEAELQWSLWKEAWSPFGSIPVHHCIGNHDIWGWNKTKSKTNGSESAWGKQLAAQNLGLEKTYYRFDFGGWRFLVLDSMMQDEETSYRAELDAQQFQWLEHELAATASTTPIVVVSHIPILTVGTVGFSQELRKYPQATRMLSHLDAPELLTLFRKHPNVKLCLSGHTHLTEQIEFGGIGFVNSGAICGLWWKGNFHHTDEGYNLVDLFDDGTFRVQYASYGWNAEGPGGR